VHGVYKPGNVKLRPEILKDAQDAVVEKLGLAPGQAVRPGLPRRLRLALEEIREAVDYGVVKMNVDTDTQYAFTRPVAGHMFSNYDGVLKVDGEVGNKKAYDPRAWGKAAEAGMAARVVEACENLRRSGSARAPAGRRASAGSPSRCREATSSRSRSWRDREVAVAEQASGTSGSLRLRPARDEEREDHQAADDHPRHGDHPVTVPQSYWWPSWMPKTSRNMPAPLSATPSQSNGACGSSQRRHQAHRQTKADRCRPGR
jgi:hypothetical protein